MPRHPRTIQSRQRIARIVINILEIHNSGIIVILARKECARELGGVDVGQHVVMRVPSPETEIESANAGKVVVNYDDL